MGKTILITGSTDGIGLEAAKLLVSCGHKILVHGRSTAKLERTRDILLTIAPTASIHIYHADLSLLKNVEQLANEILETHMALDVLINNAGVYCHSNPHTSEGLDARFMVNTIAPYLLTEKLARLLGPSGRVINVSAASQTTVDVVNVFAFKGLSSKAAYEQSKMALTMWGFNRAAEFVKKHGPSIITVVPGSKLATKLLQDAKSEDKEDIGVGANVLARAATSDEFDGTRGKYFDNSVGGFCRPHQDVFDRSKMATLLLAHLTVVKDFFDVKS